MTKYSCFLLCILCLVQPVQSMYNETNTNDQATMTMGAVVGICLGVAIFAAFTAGCVLRSIKKRRPQQQPVLVTQATVTYGLDPQQAVPCPQVLTPAILPLEEGGDDKKISTEYVGY